MITITRNLCCLFLSIAMLPGSLRAADPVVKEEVLAAPHGLKIKVRMEGPYTADVPLQIVCYFPYSPEAVRKMSGAPVELDKHLDGAIALLRERGEFRGDLLESVVIQPKAGAIKAESLLLIGLGPEPELSLERLARVGEAGLREAIARQTKRVAFAPLIRDQGNNTLPAKEVERAIVKALLLAYDTEKGLQQQGLARSFDLEEWIVEAGPAFFDDTVLGVREAIREAEATITLRSAIPDSKPR